MKKIKYIVASSLIMIGLVSLNSCNKNLDIDISKELEVNYFGSEYRITQGIGGAYAEITNIYGADLNNGTKHAFWLLPGDDITSDGSGNSLETFAGLSGGNGPVVNMWKTYYKVISRCNFMLEKIEEPAVSEIYKTPGLKDANKAEMLFIRSWCNFKLWDNWRKAPLQIKRITSATDAILPPSKDFELLDNAIASLEEAAPLAKESWNDLNSGRITRDACYGLLVKLYVTRACYNSKNAADYGKAITAYGKISADRMAAFSSVAYGASFDYRTENNAESLFEFQASIQPGGQDNAWLDNDFGGDVGQMAAFFHYSDTHWGNYNSGIFGPSQKLIEAFDEFDPRKAETLSNDADNVGGSSWWINPTWDRFMGYQLVKYNKGERGNIVDPMWQIGSNNNPRLLRMADVKLCVAEAWLATGNAGAALVQVNDVRQRARFSTADGTEASAPAALTSVMMGDIMNERFLELAGEDGHRWSDLKRWHAAGYINLDTWTAADFGFPAQYDANLFKFDASKHLLFPIPTAELDRNPEMAASGQNPGY